jgi:hypothetical protein
MNNHITIEKRKRRKKKKKEGNLNEKEIELSNEKKVKNETYSNRYIWLYGCSSQEKNLTCNKIFQQE